MRKISGYRKPSQANEAAFERAVDEIAAISWRLLGELETAAPPRVREPCGSDSRRAGVRPGFSNSGAWHRCAEPGTWASFPWV